MEKMKASKNNTHLKLIEKKNTNDSIPNLLTISEVCHVLKVSESLLRKLIFQKAIPVTRIGSCIRFDQSSLIQWIKSNTEHVKHES